MCFSLEASFVASAALSTAGVIGLKKAGKTPYRLLALIPLFFGVQQFCEGIVWTASIYTDYAYLLDVGTYSFIFFAWIIWPIFLPYTFWRLEKKKTRKKLLLIILLLGIAVSILLCYLMLSVPINAVITDCSVDYNFDFQHKYISVFGILYVITTTFSCMVSSTGKVWLLGIINIITYAFSKIYFGEHIISVWCFFAAISSMVILWIIIDLNRNKNLPMKTEFQQDNGI